MSGTSGLGAVSGGNDRRCIVLDSAYVWILLAKLCAVAITAGLGVRNRWYWLVRLDQNHTLGASRFRAVLLGEMVVLLLVLVIAAKLGVTMQAQWVLVRLFRTVRA
ncbi:MAG: CopD family protein [Glaciimonas sp.]|nr:CopD family protein [Glaciimonas sp.]